eukprot:TRINITY_DN1512_c0_g2_i1.p1 TRINITY_DN1512_c0_g2~~TRINITY_DN1512_c0_g2_i1.p1  ORF type:complete len:109 (+),score=28.46 TRINITY_DN1512_c0_g2_i1:263-589(+)
MVKIFFPNMIMWIQRGGNELAASKRVIFNTQPKWGKMDIRNYLRAVYGVEPLKINTMNYEGKTKRVRYGWKKEKDWKKVIVTFAESFGQQAEPSTQNTPTDTTTKTTQ